MELEIYDLVTSSRPFILDGTHTVELSLVANLVIVLGLK